MFHFNPPLKKSENFMFSDGFSGYRRGTSVEEGLDYYFGKYQ